MRDTVVCRRIALQGNGGHLPVVFIAVTRSIVSQKPRDPLSTFASVQ